MLDLVWLIPAIPLGGAAANLLVGRRLGRAAGILGSLTVAISLVLSLAVLVDLLSLPGEERLHVRHLFDWITVGSFQIGADLRVDPLSVTMILVVTGVGALIHVYSLGYMAEDARYARFFGYMNLFVFFMLVLVLADNFLLLFLGWEGVGLCSYLLIGFWFEKKAASDAAKKAFVTTRIGDTAMMVGLALIFVEFGSLGFGEVLDPLAGETLGSGLPSQAAFTVIALLLLAGAVGKSAQVPLHVWLPDAMEGPTPVSALIHAATMVTAGVYLVVRTHVLFELSGTALTVVLVIGLVTALYAALAALGQDDIKRVLAYSTVSQLGFMFFAAGMAAYATAIFFLVVHAFYKALMFLSAGSVMHGMDGETDLKRMGGLARSMPATTVAFVVGALALSGVPPLSGFFAKDHVLNEAALSGRTVAWVFGMVAAFFSAMYIARLISLAFLGERRSGHHPHESPPVMTLPLAMLAVGAAGGGILGLSAADGVLDRFLEPVVGHVPEHLGGIGLSEGALIVLSVLVALAGIAGAWWVWGSGRVDWAALRERAPDLQVALERAFFVDDLYAAAVEVPGKTASRFLVTGVDERVVDGVVNGAGWATQRLASALRVVQTGFVRSYALAFLFGAAAVLLYLGVRL